MILPKIQQAKTGQSGLHSLSFEQEDPIPHISQVNKEDSNDTLEIHEYRRGIYEHDIYTFYAGE